MLRKKEAFTVVTPIPGFIPRQLAIDILHSHSEVITLNPLVLEHRPITAPRNAAADEYYSTWYEIVERIQYVPGVGKAGSGKISFNGCFHDMPWGLQTHIYAPMNIDLRHKYRIGGNMPGYEAPETREIGLEALGAPADGLYLREDIEIKCNIAMVSFVKSQLKSASKDMVQRIIKKAELLDAGVLRAMVEDGKLKTFNPNDRSRLIPNPGIPPDVGGGPLSPQRVSTFYAPGLPSSPTSGSIRRPHSSSPQPYQTSQSPYQQGPGGLQQQYGGVPPIPPKEQFAPVELPADMQQAPAAAAPGLQPRSSYHYRDSASSSDPRWSQGQPSPSLADTHRTSYSSMGSGGGGVASGQPSPGFPRQNYPSELAAHTETQEEYRRQ
ncbi:NACHT and WD40 domain-containingprotein [Purpureocillium lavendulum]|uniref:NACHT and WD40 domain-containingprotein n=1 Tax=Purpureocillium lavendulum TaxID=1247861 RepID=A0AB34FDC5_9HYPO|nr:NACHT and WD40 domain-containingprotein [Purpureocillium lavendulum]